MRLLQEGCAPQRILACTFTRTAAHDIAREIAALGVSGAGDVWSGTLHSLSFSILSGREVFQATGRVPRPLAKVEERFLLQDLQANFDGIRKATKRLLAFEGAWARMQADQPGWPSDAIDREFQRQLLAWLQFHGAILVGELVPVTLRYLRDNPLCEERSRFTHVLVDEYQDLNRAEQALVDVIAAEANLSIIGDEDQSIYSFKHAHPEGISTFRESHPGTHDETLDVCRRCPTSIVALANAVIRNNATYSSRPLRPRSENAGGVVHVVQWPSMLAEARGAAEYIHKRIREDNVAPGQVLVLAPRRQIGQAVRSALAEHRIESFSFFSEQALDGDPKAERESAGQQAYALLALLANPEDRVALRCWCGLGSKTLNETQWRRLRSHCESTGEHPRVVLEQLSAGATRISRTEQLVQRFERLRAKVAQLEGLRGQELVNSLFPETEEWSHPLRSIAAKAMADGCDMTASELLDEIRAGVTQIESPEEVDSVRIMSLHKSKGLTARVVLVLGCNEGMIPRIDYDEPQEEQSRQLEEQRRLFYVALTRSTETVVVSSIAHIPRNQSLAMGLGVQGGGASRFVDELGPTRPAVVNGAALLA